MNKDSIPDDARINLVEYIISVRSFYRFIIESVFYLLVKNFFVILLFTLIGLFAGWFLYQTNRNCFQSETVFGYTVQQKKVYGEMIKNLQFLVDAKNSKLLGNALSVSPLIASNIINIEAYNIKKGQLFEDITSENLPFYVRISMTDTSGKQQLQSGLLYYFNSSPVAFLHNSIQTKELNERIARISNDINFLQKAENNYMKNNQRRYFNNDTAIIHELYHSEIAMETYLLESKKLLSETKAVYIIQNITVIQRPQSKAHLIFMIKAGFIGFLSGCMIGLLFLPAGLTEPNSNKEEINSVL
jgi:hypothetical protein